MTEREAIEYVLLIKTQPHTGWFSPEGWGPYYTQAEANQALAQAKGLWMSAQIKKATRVLDEAVS